MQRSTAAVTAEQAPEGPCFWRVKVYDTTDSVNLQCCYNQMIIDIHNLGTVRFFFKEIATFIEQGYHCYKNDNPVKFTVKNCQLCL